MAISQKNAGSWAAASATTQTVTLPTHAAGDMLIVRVAAKGASGSPPSTVTLTVSTSGWAAVGTQFQNGTNNSGNGTGSLAFRTFWKIATSAAETNPVVDFGGVTPSPSAAVAIVYQKAADEDWVDPTGAGGGDSTARTAHTATISSHITVTAGDMVDFWTAWCDNYAATVPSITQTGVTFGTVGEYPATALSSLTGNDIAADGGYRLASTGTSSAAAVVTGTFGNAEEGGSWQTRLRVNKNISGELAVTATRTETNTLVESNKVSGTRTETVAIAGRMQKQHPFTDVGATPNAGTSGGYGGIDYDGVNTWVALEYGNQTTPGTVSVCVGDPTIAANWVQYQGPWGADANVLGPYPEYKLRYGNGYWVAQVVFTDTTWALYYATDPAGTWTRVTDSTLVAAENSWGFLSGLSYANSTWVVQSGPQILYATNPSGTWTAFTSTLANIQNNFRYENSVWVSCGESNSNANGSVYTATSLTGTWTQRQTIFGGRLYDIEYADGYWVVVGANGVIWYTADPTVTNNFTNVPLTDAPSTGLHLIGLSYGVSPTGTTGSWVAVGFTAATPQNAVVYTAPSGSAPSTWTSRVTGFPPSSTNSFTSVDAQSNNELFVISGTHTRLATSTDPEISARSRWTAGTKLVETVSRTAALDAVKSISGKLAVTASRTGAIALVITSEISAGNDVLNDNTGYESALDTNVTLGYNGATVARGTTSPYAGTYYATTTTDSAVNPQGIIQFARDSTSASPGTYCSIRARVRLPNGTGYWFGPRSQDAAHTGIGEGAYLHESNRKSYDFASNISGWSSSSGTATWDTTEYHTASGSLKFVGSTQWDTAEMNTAEYLPVAPQPSGTSKQVYWGGWIKVTSGTFQLRATFYDASLEYLLNGGATNFSSSTWTQISLGGLSIPSSAAYVTIDLYVSSVGGGTAYLDEPYISVRDTVDNNKVGTGDWQEVTVPRWRVADGVPHTISSELLANSTFEVNASDWYGVVT